MTDKPEPQSLTPYARKHLNTLLGSETVPPHLAKLLPEFWLQIPEPEPGFYSYTTRQGNGLAFRAPHDTDEEDELHWWFQDQPGSGGDWCTWADVAARLKALGAHLVPMELGTNARAIDPQLRSHSYRVPLDFTNWTNIALHPRNTNGLAICVDRDSRGCGQLTVRDARDVWDGRTGKPLTDARLTAEEMRTLATALLQLAEMYDHDSRRLS